MASLLLLTAALSTLSANAILTAGNENYAYTRQITGLQKRETAASYAQTSITFKVGSGEDAKEYLSPVGKMFKSHLLTGEWGLGGTSPEPIPVTVFNVAGEVTCDSLTKQVGVFMASDDVWDPSFMQAIILQTSSSFHVNADVATCLTNWGGSLIVKSGNATSDVSKIGLAHVKGSMVPQGPYVAHVDGNITLTEVSRSYRDEAQALTSSVVHTVENTFADITAAVPGLNTLSIPVPSRLYTINQTNSLPLAGKRIVVKDIYDMAGFKTGCGNRAYFNTYPERTVTAVSIQRLVDQGAIIVARAKTSSFANGESATADWVDQMCPFNPRADGYQQPSSSSSGPGAAIATYPWLDAAIGSDTGCSILCPAGANGVYGMRPTHGSISLEGVMPLQPVLDTAGFLHRDPTEAAKFSRAMYGNALKNYTSFPKTIFYPNSSWVFTAGAPAEPIFRAFRANLTALLGATEDGRRDENFWNTTGQFASHNNTSIATYLARGYGDMIAWYQWFNFAVPWFQDYAAGHGGKTPFIAPSPQIRWGYAAANVTERQYLESVARKEEYKAWFNQTVLVADPVTCSNALYVEPWSSTNRPSYRNVYGGPPSIGYFGYGIYNFAGVPQLNIPIGQVPFNSTISGQTEYLPVTVGLIAAEGCDYMLWDIAVALKAAGVIKEVATGTVAYP